MPVGSPPGVAGARASTALPTLIAARSVPLGARSEPLPEAASRTSRQEKSKEQKGQG